MFALKAAKRMRLIVSLVILLLAAPLALAGDGQGYLGVALQDISSSMAKALQLDDQTGVLVSNVLDDSPAEDAGLEDGDVILEFDGTEIEDGRDLTRAVRDTDPGDSAELLVLRDGKRKTFKVELGERELDVAFFGDDRKIVQEKLKKLGKLHKLNESDELENVFESEDGEMHWLGDGEHKVVVMPDSEHARIWIGKDGDVTDLHFNSDRGFMGVHLDDISGQLGEFFGADEGALVTEVNEDSPAAKAGLKAGDVIVRANGEDVASTDKLHKAMSETEPGQTIKIDVVRKGDAKSFDVVLTEIPEDAFAGRYKVFQDGDRNIQIRTPRIWHHFEDGGDVEVEVFENDHPRVMIRELLDDDDDDLDELRSELKELRKELKEMRKNLQK